MPWEEAGIPTTTSFGLFSSFRADQRCFLHPQMGFPSHQGHEEAIRLGSLSPIPVKGTAPVPTGRMGTGRAPLRAKGRSQGCNERGESGLGTSCGPCALPFMAALSDPSLMQDFARERIQRKQSRAREREARRKKERRKPKKKKRKKDTGQGLAKRSSCCVGSSLSARPRGSPSSWQPKQLSHATGLLSCPGAVGPCPHTEGGSTPQA